MKSSLRDRAEGVGKQAKGKVKEAAGRASNNRDLTDEGVADQLEGKVQQKVGQVKKVLGQ